MAQYQLETIMALRDDIIEANKHMCDKEYAFTVMDDLEILPGTVCGGTHHFYGDNESDMPSAEDMLYDANLLAEVVSEDME